MPGYVDGTLGLLESIRLRINQSGELHLLDFSDLLQLYSSKNLRGRSPILDYVDEQSNFQVRKIVNQQNVHYHPHPDLKIGMSSYLHSFFLSDKIKGNFLERALGRRVEKSSQHVYNLVSRLLTEEHFCSTLVLNGRDSLGAATRLAARDNSVAIFFWEHSPEHKIYLCDHPPQDYFSYRKELQFFEPTPDQVKDAEKWLVDRTELKSSDNPYSKGWSDNDSSVGSKKIDFCIFTSSQDEFWSLGDLIPEKKYGDFYDEVVGLLNTHNSNNLNFALRIHPNTLNKSVSYALRNARKALALKKKFPNLKMIWPNEKINSYDLIRASRCVLVENSTIGAEAAWLGVPVRYLAPSLYVGLSSETLYSKEEGFISVDDSKLNLNRQLAVKDVALLRSHMKIEYEPKLMFGWKWYRSISSISGPWTLLFLLLRTLSVPFNRLIFGALSQSKLSRRQDWSY